MELQAIDHCPHEHERLRGEVVGDHVDANHQHHRVLGSVRQCDQRLHASCVRHLPFDHVLLCQQLNLRHFGVVIAQKRIVVDDLH
jgi:hypothetical protein